MLKSAKLSLAIYVATIAVPTLTLLYLEFRSIERQRKVSEELSAANLALLGEQLTSEIENSVRSGMQECLHDAAIKRLLSSAAPTTFVEARFWRAQWENLRKTCEFADELFMVEGNQLVYPLQYPPFQFPDEAHEQESYDRFLRPRELLVALQSTTESALEQTWSDFAAGRWELSADQVEWFSKRFCERLALTKCPETRFLKHFAVARVLTDRFRYYAPLNQNEVQPYGFVEPLRAQLFYAPMRRGPLGERIVFVSVDLDSIANTILPRSQIISGVKNDAKLLEWDAPGNGLPRVYFKTLFPFWRLGIQPAPGAGALDTHLFPAVTAAVLAALIFGTVLLLRDHWRQGQMSQLRASFVSGVSHEFRTPLTAIRLFADTLSRKRDATADERAEFCRVIARESERLNQLVGRVLEYSRIGQERTAYSLRAQDLAATVAGALERYRTFWQEQGFKVEEAIARDLPPVRHDPDAISQALLNLIDNAIKYSGESRTVQVRLHSGRDATLLEVQDHGSGIPAEERGKIFEQFYRGSGHPSKGGYGLGLYLVRQIMLAHSGSVEVDSEAGHASTFRLIFPTCPKS